MNPNPGTTRRALGRGVPHGALWPGRSKTLSSQDARDTLVPEPPGAARRSQPRRGEPAPHSRTSPLLWDATQAAAPRAWRCGRCAPPRPLSARATPPVRRDHASVRRSHAQPGEAPPSGLSRPRPSQAIAPPVVVSSWLPPPATSCHFLPLKLPWPSETPGTRAP